MNPQVSTTHKDIARLRRLLGAAGVALVVTVASHAVLANAQTAPAPMPQGGPAMQGQMADHGPGLHRDRGMQRMLTQAGVTAAQQEQLRALRKQSWEKLRPDMEQMRTLMQQRMKLLAAPTIDRGALEALRDKQMALVNQISQVRTQTQYEMAKILTPEQRAKLYTMMQQRMERMPHHGGMGPMGGADMMQ
ncbi:MAG: Spy/CpxP family protein refolding chaperone [Thiomonas sp.]